MTILVDAEIMFNKIQFPFMTDSQHPGRKELFHSDKSQLQKPLANSILNGIRIVLSENQERGKCI